MIHGAIMWERHGKVGALLDSGEVGLAFEVPSFVLSEQVCVHF